MNGPKPRKIERILVRGTNWIGDAVMSAPALQRLRTSFPAARISLLATPLTAELFDASRELVDEVIPYHRSRDGWRTLWQTVPRLRRGRFELAILFQNAFEAALLTALAGIPERIGFGVQGRSWLLTRRLARRPEHRGRHQIHDYLDLVAAGEELAYGAGFVAPLANPWPRLPVGEAELAAGLQLLGRHGAESDRLVALNVGATNSRAKCWPAGYFAELAERLTAETGARVILIGGPGEITTAGAVAALTSGRPPLNLAGATSLRELLGVLSRCALVISNDTGPAHIAAALGRPTLTLFGPTNEFETSPTGPHAALLRADNIECARCMYRDCPIDHRCMTRLSVGAVYNRAMELMKS